MKIERRARPDVEHPRDVRLGLRGLERAPPAEDRDALPLLEPVVERAAPLAQRERGGRQVDGQEVGHVQRHPAVHVPQPLEDRPVAVLREAERLGRPARELGHLGTEDGVGDGEPEPLHLLVEEAFGRLEEPRALARVGDESAPALDARDQPLRFEPLERQAHRRARDPEPGADLGLGGEALARGRDALHDLLGQEPRELEVERHG